MMSCVIEVYFASPFFSKTTNTRMKYSSEGKNIMGTTKLEDKTKKETN